MSSARLRFTVVGCGSSPGVPRVNGDWGDCDPTNPRNRRTRAAALVQRITSTGTTTVVIDTGPDFREQMIAARIRRLDAAIFTHGHADHIHGIDDLRGYVLAQGRLMDIYADAPTYDRLLQGFSYCFLTPPGSSYPPILKAHIIEPSQPIVITGEGGTLTFEPLHQLHGDIASLGFRIGPLAYCPDVSHFPANTLDRMAGLDLLVIDALQHTPHPSHLSLGQALQWIERIAPRHAWLTHMNTPLDYEAVKRATPDHVLPAHDGLTIEYDLSVP